MELQRYLRRFNIIEIIIHDVPRKTARHLLGEDGTERETPTYSDIASPIDDEITGFFHGKIVDTIGSSSAIRIQFLEGTQSPSPRLIDEYFRCNEERRIEVTRIIAQHLYITQTAINSSGLLAFIHCSVGEEEALAIMKVERERGVKVELTSNEEGQQTFDVEHIRNLILTEKTKLFKIALFKPSQTIIQGYLRDEQRSYGSRDVANFFLSDFLGCEFSEEPKMLTKKFSDSTQQYIDEKISSPEQKSAVLNHMLSELTNQNSIINTNVFARTSLPVEKIDEYLHYILDKGVTSSSFQKDCTVIESHIKKIQYSLESGISIQGTSEAINEFVNLSEMEDEKVKLEIIDRLKGIRAK